MHRVSRFATSFALTAFAVITAASTRAEAQRSRVRGPRFGQLGVVRDYDGAPGSTVAMVPAPAPLDIVRNYDTADGIANGAHDSLIPMAIAPWDGPATIEVTSTVPTAPVSARAGMSVLPRLSLVAFDGSEMTLTPLDASVRSLSVITDFDADATTGSGVSGGSVRVTYDSSGSVVHVETALPAMPVASSAPPARPR